ncbi:MAG: GspE/PulE family protein [Campylobacterota bacterium]
MSILNEIIDYKVLENFDMSLLKELLIMPYYEDDLSIYVFVCSESNLLNIDNIFSKLVKYKEIKKRNLLFLYSNIKTKIYLYKACQKTMRVNVQQNSILKDFVDCLLAFAIENRASDIHIERLDKKALFKFRVDGNLKTFFACEIEFLQLIASYFKLISNLDVTQTRLPLDSRFTQFINNKKYNFRLSTMPTLNFESIVIRILDNINVNSTVESLNFSSHILLDIKSALELSQGLILVTGPTGSGKTTTLYSMLNELKKREKKIITVEDPVEYKIDEIAQVQIDNKIGLSFEIVLKNILRQDPDIIFIGEIRDKFSLQIALQASLTGHLVLASIHSNSSAQTITRLLDLDADPFLVATTLKLVLSQRLVLAYCKECENSGCKKCNYTGFYGRTNISESLKVDEELSSIIFKKSDLSNISKYQKSKGFISMYEDGVNKVNKNITSMQEVLKVVSL